MALTERWMRLAVCQAFPELPWLEDRSAVSRVDEIGMRAACRACGVFERCAAFVELEQISGGFWAGDFREVVADAVDGAA